MKCQADNCPKPGTILLILGCGNQHLTETRCCPSHLKTLRELTREHKIWCHCQQPVITGMYQDDKQEIRKLNEETT